MQERLAAERRLEEEQGRALRARAELDTVRRRATGDQDRAREAGLDTAVLPVMAVYDDLRRALQAAEAGDPASIVPGVRAVIESLERNLARLDIERVGDPGQPFDPDLHEALTSTPVAENADARHDRRGVRGRLPARRPTGQARARRRLPGRGRLVSPAPAAAGRTEGR